MNVAELVHRGNILFSDVNPYVPSPFPSSVDRKMALKVRSNYTLPTGFLAATEKVAGIHASVVNKTAMITQYGERRDQASSASRASLGSATSEASNQEASSSSSSSSALILPAAVNAKGSAQAQRSSALIARKSAPKVPKPNWHAPWELSAVISGHLGWVRAIAFDPSNEWFATGAADRTIKIWDFAKCCAGAEGGLKLTLTGHVSAVRGLVVSPRHPYLFSVGEDKLVKCWDLEYNKVIRHYHGHLSGVYSVAMHPTLDLLVSGGRDSVARVWDIRTKHQIHVLGGHSGTVSSILTTSVDPQVITGSQDSTVKLWDLAAGKSMSTLTQHKKAVRCLALNPRELTFVSGAADNIKKWQCRDGKFLNNMSGHNSVINSISINDDGVAVSGGDNGSLWFWDYETGYCFQRTETVVQPGSLDAEAGIFASSFDLTGSRFITCEADKTIKIWKENQNATEDTHPIDMKSWTKQCLSLKRY